MNLTFDIIIPNFNGLKLLQENVSRVEKALKKSSFEGRILVVDDASSDESVSYLKQNHPDIKVIQRTLNGGFIESCNTGIQNSNRPVFILLNSDIQVELDFIDPLLCHFTNQSIFSVSALSYCPTPLIDRFDPSLQVNESICQAVWQNNMLDKYQPEIYYPDNKFKYTCTNLFCSGGYSAYHRGKYDHIGGFDSLFKPYYWEDIDLCYRAWQNGWVSLFEPASIVHHQAHGTIKQDADRRARFLMETRNRFFFNWKYMDDYGRIIKHLGFLFRLVFRKKSLDEFEQFLREALFQALPSLPGILFSRLTTTKSNNLNMENIVYASQNKEWTGFPLKNSK